MEFLLSRVDRLQILFLYLVCQQHDNLFFVFGQSLAVRTRDSAGMRYIKLIKRLQKIYGEQMGAIYFLVFRLAQQYEVEIMEMQIHDLDKDF